MVSRHAYFARYLNQRLRQVLLTLLLASKSGNSTDADFSCSRPLNLSPKHAFKSLLMEGQSIISSSSSQISSSKVATKISTPPLPGHLSKIFLSISAQV